MKLKKLLVVATVSVIINSNFATASLLCSSGTVIGGRVASICANFEIPDNGTIYSNHMCDGYEVTVECDLHNKPNTLELSLTNEQGEVRSTDSEIKLSWGDGNGNGVFINCLSQ